MKDKSFELYGKHQSNGRNISDIYPGLSSNNKAKNIHISCVKVIYHMWSATWKAPNDMLILDKKDNIAVKIGSFSSKVSICYHPLERISFHCVLT